MSKKDDANIMFNSALLQERLKAANSDLIKEKWQVYRKKFIGVERQETIRNMNEEEYNADFLRDLFVDVLGYTMKPDANYNLVREKKTNINARKPDGAIIDTNAKTATNPEGKILVAIELKSTKTKDLEEAVKQAFEYKNSIEGCRYVIVSNFSKLRLYIDNLVRYREFDIFFMKEDDFAELYVILCKQSVLSGDTIDIYEKSKTIREQVVTKELYEDYSAFKNELYEDIAQNNTQYDKLSLFKKTQKLIDRILFILFAEDCGLLGTSTINDILRDWKHQQSTGRGGELYDSYKMWFDFINQGNDRIDPKIFAYNGGLFAEDEILDNIKISSHVLEKHSKKLKDYDFHSDVDVNILGHIFEHSLGDIEQKTAEINGIKTEKGKDKRKSDGIFYTPKYITNYIVKNTIGKLCEEKQAELKINEIAEIVADPNSKINKKDEKAYLATLKQYREWLLTLKIIDPACGSGAFLNEALSFLIEEHERIDRMQNNIATGGAGIEFTEIEKKVLEQNIFGVDINEESVEIARLSLWLRTAKQGRKLSKLSNNIKCGNSLISDTEVAGEKAFDWNAEFPDIMQNGGFDVVIGNPPYVRKQGLEANYPELTAYYEEHFVAATGNYDIYALFMERALSLIKATGEIGFILPHKFLLSEFGVGIRGLFAERRLVDNIVHFGSHLVFEEASTYTCIINLNNRPKEIVKFQMMSPKELENEFSWESEEYAKLSENKWNLQDKRALNIINKMKLQKYTVSDVFDKVYVGLQTSLDKVYVFEGQEVGNTVKAYNKKSDYYFDIEKDIVRPIVGGKDISKYKPLEKKKYTLFPYKIENGKATPYSEADIKEKYPKAYDYIKKFEREIRGREKNRMNIEDYWMSYIYPKNLAYFDSKKIMCQYLSLGSTMTYDEAGEMYHNTKVYSLIKKDKFEVDDKFYLAIFNSKLMWFFIKNTSVVFRGGYYVYSTEYINPFPLPEVPKNADEFISLADKMLKLNKQLQEKVQSFVGLLKADLKVELKAKDRNNVFELSEEDFMSAIRSKAPVNERQQWLLLFKQYQGEAKALKEEIESTDKTIDAMVYKLYGLSEEEIKIVEA